MKQARSKMMTGGAGPDEVNKAAAAAAAVAAAAATNTIVQAKKDSNVPVPPPPPLEENIPAEESHEEVADGDGAAADADATKKVGDTDAADAADGADADATKKDGADAADAADADAAETAATEAKPKFNLGPSINGDISLHTESRTLKSKETVHFIEFLIQSGKPYYIQIKPKVGDKTLLNISNTDVFELRRILYGKFTTTKDYDAPGKIPDEQRQLYFKPPDVVGIAGGDSISLDTNGNIMIYTGETAMVARDSTDKAIKLTIQGSDKSVTVTDTKRLYILSSTKPPVPATIQTVSTLRSYGEHIDETCFRIQISPVTELTLKNAAGPSSSSSDEKEEVFADESNTYVVNFSDGSEVTAIQTLRKSLEVARKNLNADGNAEKNRIAFDVFKMLRGILENKEFIASEGYDEFKESIYNYSYQIPGQESKYGFVQLKTYFDENRDKIDKDTVKEFFNVLTLLGKGVGGENAACNAMSTPSSALFETRLIFEEDGTTKQITKILDKGTVPEFIKILEKGMNGSKKDEESEKKPDEKKGAKEEGAAGGKVEEGEAAGAEEGAGAEEAAAAGEAAEEAAEGPGPEEGEAAAVGPEEGEAAGAEEGPGPEEGEAAGAGAGSEEGGEATGTKDADAVTQAAATAAAAAAAAATAEIILASKTLQIEEVDIKRVWGEWQKGYIVKRYKLDNLPLMLLVHYMGELLSEDEFIPASKESEKIRPRTETAIVGGVGITDRTPEELKSLYSESLMKNYEIDAKAAAAAVEPAAPAAGAAADTSAIHIASQEIPPKPIRPAEEVTAINKLYEKYDKKAEKVQKIIGLKKTFNAGIRSLATMLLEMYKKSLESYATWEKSGPIYQKKMKKNSYIDSSDDFHAIKDKFEQELKSFKKRVDFKYIDGDADDCDKIISDFKPSDWKPAFLTSSENKELLIKICRLFSMYKRWMGQIELYNEYFKKWNDLEGGWDLKFNKQSQETVIKNFNYYSNSLTGILTDLDKDVKDTEVLEQGVVEPQPQGIRVGGGGGNKRKNVRTRRRAKHAK
jgi:hypothetical protein